MEAAGRTRRTVESAEVARCLLAHVLPHSEGPEIHVFFDGTLASAQLQPSNTDEAREKLVLGKITSRKNTLIVKEDMSKISDRDAFAQIQCQPFVEGRDELYLPR